MKKKIKICQFCGVQYPYDKFLIPLCKELVKEKFLVKAAFAFDRRDNKPFQKGVDFKNIFYKRKTSLLSSIKTIFQLYFYFRKEKFDIVQVHTPLASIPGRIAAKLAGIKVIIYKVHGYYFHENMNFLNKSFHIFLEFFLSKITDYILTVSKEDEILAKVLGFKNTKKILYIGNGIDKSIYSPVSRQENEIIRNSFQINKKFIVIGIVSRLIEEKGLNELFTAFDNLAKHNKNLALLICGSRLKSDYVSGVSYQLNVLKKKYGNRVLEIGQSNEVFRVYRAMDIFCLPSYREGLPYTVLEAMMSGLPIIASNIRGNREAVINNQTGLLCEQKDINSLQKALKILIDDKKKRKYFGKMSRKRAIEIFDLENILVEEIKIIKTITDKI